MEKISFPYRAATHLNLLHVIGESGSWARYELDVNFNYQIQKNDAHRAVANAEVEFVGGNHVSTMDIARDGLYRKRRGGAKADKNKHDPDYRREQERKQMEVIAALKACGHLESESCDCH